jgi:hypothetical protein
MDNVVDEMERAFALATEVLSRAAKTSGTPVAV